MEIELNSLVGDKSKWNCRGNTIEAGCHLEKGDPVTIEDDFVFERNHFWHQCNPDTIKVPKGTKGVITNIWDGGAKDYFVDVVTNRGTKLCGIPYYCVEWIPPEEQEKPKEQEITK